VDQLLPEAKERIKEKHIFGERYRELYKQVPSGGNIDKSFQYQMN
jgi:hypothetical protein